MWSCRLYENVLYGDDAASTLARRVSLGHSLCVSPPASRLLFSPQLLRSPTESIGTNPKTNPFVWQRIYPSHLNIFNQQGTNYCRGLSMIAKHSFMARFAPVSFLTLYCNMYMVHAVLASWGIHYLIDLHSCAVRTVFPVSNSLGCYSCTHNVLSGRNQPPKSLMRLKMMKFQILSKYLLSEDYKFYL